MNEVQKQVISLLERAEPKGNLKKWLKGYIPLHYKRLSIGMDEAYRLAVLGAKKANAYFGSKLYFTQSLLFGAVEEGKYKSFIVVTPSQYGKSWLCGQIALWLANKGRQVYIAGGNTNTTEIIMGKTVAHLQTVDNSIKQKLLEPVDRIERMSTSLSKRKLGFVGGGLVESMSLGESFKDPVKGNAAIGRGGDYIIDEASLVSSNAYAELGRREFANESGEKYISFEISNPHNPGQFFDRLTAEQVPADTLIVWMDARTALEEGRFKSKQQIIDSEFFKNKSTCKRYLLCELEDYAEESIFPEPKIEDEPLPDGTEYFLGVDSAYKGEDNIEAVLVGMKPSGEIRVQERLRIKKDNWVDGKTGQEIIRTVLKIILGCDVKMVCVDIGFGVYIVEGLSQRAVSFSVKGVNFGSGTTKMRKDSGHFSAVYGDNKRAEMHLDLSDLMENKKVTFTSEMAEVLKEQMNAVRAVRKPNGKTAIIPKDDIKKIIGRSPDELDATLLAVHAAVLYSLSGGTLIYEDD